MPLHAESPTPAGLSPRTTRLHVNSPDQFGMHEADALIFAQPMATHSRAEIEENIAALQAARTLSHTRTTMIGWIGRMVDRTDSVNASCAGTGTGMLSIARSS